MDVGSFLTAQLWLHPLPPDAWPGGAGDDQAAKANDSRGRAILTGARCCFVLSEGSRGGGSTDSSMCRRRPLSFSAPSAQRRCPFPTRKEGVLTSGGNSDVWERRPGGGQAQEAADAPSRQFGSRGDRDRDGRSEILGAGEEVRENRKSCFRDAFDFGLAIGVGDDARSETAKADSGSGARASPTAGDGGRQPAEGTLLLRIQGTVYQAEYPLIRSIAYPKGSPGGVINNTGNARGAELKVSSAYPIGRTGVGGVRATASVETSNRTASGGGGAAIDEIENACHDRTGSSRGSSRTDKGIGGNGSDDGSMTRKGSGTKDFGTLSRHGDDVRYGRMCVTTKTGRDSVTRCIMNGVDDTASGDAGRNEGAGDQTVAGSAVAGDAPSNLRRNDAPSPHNDPGRVPGEGPVPVTRKRKLGASTAYEAEENAIWAEGGEVHRHRDRDVDDAEDGPFCGLLFPGVLLKFWLPPGQAAEKIGAIRGRGSAVSKLQGVVSDMIEGLTPNMLTHPLARGTAREELEKLTRSAMAEARNEGFSALVNAWDEFVHGSNLLVLEHLCRQPEEYCHDNEQEVVGVGSSPKNRKEGGIGGGGGGGERCVDRDFPVLSCPPLSATDVSGKMSAIGARGISSFAVGNSAGVSWCFPSDGLSAVGRSRALTSLADCFSRASLPQPVRSAVRDQLQAAEIRAAAEVEEVLDRAFPLDLLQEADGESRVSMMSELQASSRRFRLAKEALLPLALLPAADMLYDSDCDPA